LSKNSIAIRAASYRRSTEAKQPHGVGIDLNRPMKAILAELSKHPVSTPLLLNGTIIVVTDIAHAKFKELIDAGKPVPEYLLKHPIYYAGPAKTPKGKASGSFVRRLPDAWIPMWICCRARAPA
jgi:hypothetical protein